MKQRPILVTIISLVMIIVGALQGVIGLVTFLNRNDSKFLADSGASSDWATSWGIALMIFGVVSVLLGFALLGGSKVARMLVGVLELLQLAGGVYLLFGGGNSHTASGVGQIMGALIVLYFLFGTDKAKAFFA